MEMFAGVQPNERKWGGGMKEGNIKAMEMHFLVGMHISPHFNLALFLINMFVLLLHSFSFNGKHISGYHFLFLPIQMKFFRNSAPCPRDFPCHVQANWRKSPGFICN